LLQKEDIKNKTEKILATSFVIVAILSLLLNPMLETIVGLIMITGISYVINELRGKKNEQATNKKIVGKSL
jgi:hypothetical protein